MAQGQPALNSAEREAVFTKLHARTLGFALYLRCGEDAKDVAQETMLELTRRYGAIQSLEELVKLANAICFNKARNLRKRRLFMQIDDNLHRFEGPSPETLLLDEEMRHVLLLALKRCSRRCRTLFLLDLEGADTEMLCHKLSVSRGSLYTIRNRCSAKLREFLQGGI